MLNSLQHSVVMNMETLCIINPHGEAHFGLWLAFKMQQSCDGEIFRESAQLRGSPLSFFFFFFTKAFHPYLITKCLSSGPAMESGALMYSTHSRGRNLKCKSGNNYDFILRWDFKGQYRSCCLFEPDALWCFVPICFFKFTLDLFDGKIVLFSILTL